MQSNWRSSWACKALFNYGDFASHSGTTGENMFSLLHELRLYITHIPYLSSLFLSQDEGFDVQTAGYGMTSLGTNLCIFI